MRIVIAGANGRMGQALQQIAAADSRFELSGLLTKDAAVESVFERAEAIIDFSAPVLSQSLAGFAASRGLIHIIGTTGFNPEEEAAIADAAQRAIIVKSGNMSLGVNLLSALVKQAAQVLGPDFDIEICEMHHRHKLDAPSGTALLLGKAAADARSAPFEPANREGRRGKGIGYASLRGGSVIGEHDVIFAGPAERLILSHKAEDRGVFARGALQAALWAKGKPAGLYSMQDVLGLKQ